MEDEGFDMEPENNEAFSIEEFKEIEVLCQQYPVIKKLADRYALIFSEPDKEFYAALCYASKRVSNLTTSEQLDIDNTKHKALLHILKEGAGYYKTLQVGKEKAGNPDREDESKEAVKAVAVKEIRSVAEKYAKDRK